MEAQATFRPGDLIVARRSVMEIVDGGLALVRVDFFPIMTLLLTLFVPFYALKYGLYALDWIPFDRVFGSFNWFRSDSYTPGQLLLLLADWSVQWTAAALVMMAWDSGDSSPSSLWRRARPLLIPLCRINCSLWIVIMAGFVLGFVGGVILYIIMLLSTCIVALERKTTFGAVWRRSEFLIKDNWSRALGLTLISLLLLGILGVSLTYLIAGAYGLLLQQIAWLSGMLPDFDMVQLASGVLVSVVLLPIQNVFVLLFYYDLRSRKEGLDLERLTEVLEERA